MNDTDVQAKNTDYKPKFHKNYKLVLQSDWLITMLFLGQHNMPHLVNQVLCITCSSMDSLQ